LLLDDAVLAVQEDSPRSLVEVGRVVARFLLALQGAMLIVGGV